MSHVPLLHARQYVALHAELALGPAPRPGTLGRYYVPTEEAYRLLEQYWQQPARRAELELALEEYKAMLRQLLLG